MAYYTISHLIKEVPLEDVNDALFDYIFLSKVKKPSVVHLETMHDEFEYWYPVNLRNSGKDLIQNHLTFY
jgi:leucyl-tRNA synthetase